MTAVELWPPAFGDGPERRAARPSGWSLNQTIRFVLIAFPIITLAIISRVGMIAWPFLNDSGLYATLGRTVANGDVLYRDFYETKLPGAALLASAFWRVFGPHWAGYVMCQMVMAFAAAAALARAARPLASAGSTFLFAVVYLNLSQAVYTGFQLETIQVFFEALAAMAAIESLANGDGFATFAAGLAAGTAAMAKPGGLGVAIAFGVVLLMFASRKWMHLVLLLLGVAIPTAITILYTVRSGAWTYLPGVVSDIRNYASGTPVQLDALIKIFVVLAILGFPFLFTLRDRKKIVGMPMPLLRAFIILWFVMDLAAALLQRRLYPYHFLPLACPAALLYGRVRPLPAALGLLPIALFSLTWEGSSISKLSRGFSPLPVSQYIASHSDENDTVFTDQIGRLLIETNRQPGSRLGTFFYLVNDDDAPRRYTQTLTADFESRKPKYLALGGNWDQPVPGLANCQILQHCPQRRENFISAWAAFREYVHLHYHLETRIDEMRIYRRN